MGRFLFPATVGFHEIDRLGGYLAARMGASFSHAHQSDEIAQHRAGPRGDLGRWISRQLFGDMTLVVSNNPLFGAALRVYREGDYVLARTHGIIPNETLRKTIGPILAICVFLGAPIVLPNAVGVALMFAAVPSYFLLPRLLSWSSVARVEKLLADADALSAAGIDAPKVVSGGGIAPPIWVAALKGLLGAAVLFGACLFLMEALRLPFEKRRPYTKVLWEDTLAGAVIAIGLGAIWLYAGGWNVLRRAVGWLETIVVWALLTATAFGAMALLGPRLFPPWSGAAGPPSLQVKTESGATKTVPPASAIKGADVHSAERQPR